MLQFSVYCCYYHKRLTCAIPPISVLCSKEKDLNIILDAIDFVSDCYSRWEWRGCTISKVCMLHNYHHHPKEKSAFLGYYRTVFSMLLSQKSIPSRSY